MNNRVILTFAILLCLLAKNSYAQNTGYITGQLFSISQLKNDLTVLRTELEKKHPNLYLYTPKPQLDATFDSLYQGINKPMTAQAFYRHITFISSLIKDGHSYILPSQESRDYANKKEKFFPLHVTWINDKMYVDMNCTADSTIKDGMEIVSINGMPAGEIMQQLLIRQVRDGNNQTYPVWILNNWFREYYSYVFGYPASFAITYTAGNNQTTANIAALSKDSIRFYIQQKYAARIIPKKDGQGIFLEVNDGLNTAILTIKTFDDDELRDDYSQNFRSAIYESFSRIKKKNIQHLILNLRDNQGGDPANGILLLSFLLNEPFTMIYKGPSAGEHKPVKEVYTGKLYVLVNGGSFSNTGMVSSCLDAHKRGVFVGQETAGNPYILSGDPEGIELPATKIHCEVSTIAYILRAQYTNDGHGVIPTHIVVPNIQDIITANDPAERVVLGLIDKEN